MSTKFEKLLEPGVIGGMKLRNRIVMLPMGTDYAGKGGVVSQRLLDYYEARAKGGVGMVVVEAACIDSPVGKAIAEQLAIDDDKFIPGFAQLAEVIKKHGAKAAIQVHHAGNGTRTETTGVQPVAPSAVVRRGYSMPREMTLTEIQETIGRFARGAERLKRAGFDAIEIHAAHSYLIAQFLSSAWNKRQDEYGGDLKNRARFLLEVLAAVRSAVGDQFRVWCRVNGKEEGRPGATTIEETCEVARMVQAAGANAISVSSAGTEGAYIFLTLMPEVRGIMLPLAAAVKKSVNIPVIAAGRITPDLGEAALREGKADFIGIGRGLIADPELPHKLAAGHPEAVRPCLACFTCLPEGGVKCAVNPAAGREGEFDGVSAADHVKKVMVVGGGPAGMEAARVAASRGHEVTLYEKQNKLGGQLILAAIPPGKKDRIEPLIAYLAEQVKSSAKLELGQEVTPDIIDRVKPDAIIMATGIVPLVPDIPGVSRSNVVLAEDVLTGKASAGKKVVIIGGELVGCETAEFLVDQGKTVTVVRRGPRMATKMVSVPRRVLLDRLAQKGVTMMPGIQYKEINDQGLVIIAEGKEKLLEADTIVLATGAKPNNGLMERVKDRVKEVYCVGDCKEPRRILEAISEGNKAGMSV